MPNPKIKLAEALIAAKGIAKDNIIKTSDISRSYREILIKTGFLKEILNGWYFLTDPSFKAGDTTLRYSSFWNFQEQYLNKKLGGQYCLSAESSAYLHTEKNMIPKQIIVMAKSNISQTLRLLCNSSLVIYHEGKNFPANIIKKNGINIMNIPETIYRLQPAFFKNNPVEAGLILKMLKNKHDLVSLLVENNSPYIAGKIAGAYQALGDEKTSNQIQASMKAIGSSVFLSNPFNNDFKFLTQTSRLISPHAGRIEIMWEAMREDIIAIFPKPWLNTKNIGEVLRKIEDIYAHDAYNSLSIEGYKVSEELIAKIRQGNWNPEQYSEDRNMADAMAAKGYSLAFNEVKKSLKKILQGAPVGEVIENEHHQWFAALFAPSIQAGILTSENIAGYRDKPVYIANAKHVPPSKEAVIDCMDTFFNLLKKEQEPSVKAVLGHLFFGFIHPYMDGNGRTSRFLMNSILVSNGFPWTIIRTETRKEYLESMDIASTERNIKPFATLILTEMNLNLGNKQESGPTGQAGTGINTPGR